MGWLSRAKGSTDDAGPAGPAGPEPAPPETVGAAQTPVGVPAPPVATRPDAPASTAATATTPPGQAPAAPAAVPPAPVGGPVGRYGPLVSVTGLDVAPAELQWQLPLNGELYRLMPGSDRPDYSLLVLERPVHFYPGDGFDLTRVEPEQRVQDRRGRQMVRVHALLLCSRFVGQQLHPGMKDLAVNLAYVIDNSLARDAVVDFGKIEYAAVGFLSEGHQQRPDAPAPDVAPATATAPAPGTRPVPPGSAVPPTPSVPEAPSAPVDLEDADARVGALLDEVARALHAGIEQARGARVERLAATITLGPDHRLTGLSGNADGQAPAPSPETFDRIGGILAGLAGLGPSGRVASASLRVQDGVASHEVGATHA